MEKSRKPKIRFKGYNDDWEQRKFRELYSKSGEKNDGSIEINKNITVATMQFKGDVKVSTSEYLKTYYTFNLGDIAFEGHQSKEFRYGRFVENDIGNGIVSHIFSVFRPVQEYDLYFWKYAINNEELMQHILSRSTKASTMMHDLVTDDFLNETFLVPSLSEQEKVGSILHNLDSLITLHQCEPKNKVEDNKMLDNINNQILFCDYYEKWIKVYKEGAIRKVTLEKYYMTHRWLKKLIPELKICEMTRINYQQLLNDYALYHERQTTMDFHHQLKGAILDAVDEGLLDRDPTRKAIIKGKTPAAKKIKYINQFELHTLLNNLNLKSEISWDWFILIVAKTGLRFSEALALTPKDFDFGRQSISVSKTWDYKGDGGFLPTKNKSSVRKVQIDWQTVIQFSELIKGLPEDKPIFVNGKVYNSTVNDILARYCKKANVPVISVHGLRHTHASLLLFAGVSIASVARRLGHSSMNTTQKTYLHIIQELESQDVDLVMRSLSGLS